MVVGCNDSRRLEGVAWGAMKRMDFKGDDREAVPEHSEYSKEQPQCQIFCFIQFEWAHLLPAHSHSNPVRVDPWTWSYCIA